MTWTEYCMSFIKYVSDRYEYVHHTKLRLNNPQTFTEKLQWLKIYDSTYLKAFCADKINVHKYYKGMLGTDIGIPIVKIFNKVSDITECDIDGHVVIKCNHGSGMNIINNAQSSLTLEEVQNKVSKWLHMDHGLNWGELYYSLVQPKCFTEQFISDMQDIKVFCFNGKPLFYQFDKHFAEHRMNFYDLNWKPMTWLSRLDYPANYSIVDSKPPIDVIYKYASILCKPFKFVRCDFIISKGKIYGGELTFVPGAGNQTYIGDGDARLGSMLVL